MAGRIESLRLGASLIAGLALAAAAGLHATSAIATRTAPEVAADLFFANAEARETLAFNAFTEAVGDPGDLGPAARSVRADAAGALKSDPTSAKALALLALASENLDARHSAALVASRINRRDLALQGLVLEAHLADRDLASVVETLDQILRVHPTYLQQFAPVLSEALREEQAVPAFARMIDGSSPWHRYYYANYALGDASLLRHLAVLRSQRPLADEEFDRRLIDLLAQQGHMNEARALFERLSGGRNVASGKLDARGRVFGWDARFPPFDWGFADTGDFRGQASLDGKELEIFVRPGHGGVVAQRAIRVPQEPFAIEADLDIDGATRDEAIRAELYCKGSDVPFAAKALEAGANTLRVSQPPRCEDMTVAINARAWSGGSTLRAKLGRISLRPAR